MAGGNDPPAMDGGAVGCSITPPPPGVHGAADGIVTQVVEFKAGPIHGEHRLAEPDRVSLPRIFHGPGQGPGHQSAEPVGLQVVLPGGRAAIRLLESPRTLLVAAAPP